MKKLLILVLLLALSTSGYAVTCSGGNCDCYNMTSTGISDVGNFTYNGGNWEVTAGENLICTARTLNLTGNLTVYGNLTLSDVDMLVNLTNSTTWDSWNLDGINNHGYNLNVTSNHIHVFSGGMLNITNSTNITANESWTTFYSGYELVAFRGSTIEVRDSFFRHVGTNNRSDWVTGQLYAWSLAWSRFHGMRIESDSNKIINNTFEVNASWAINVWNSSFNQVENNTVIGTGRSLVGGGVLVVNYPSGSNNTIFNNTIYDVHHATYGWNAINNTFANNTVYKTMDQIKQYGTLLFNYSKYNLIENNTYIGLNGTDSGAVWLEYYVSNTTVEENIIKYVTYGVLLYYYVNDTIIKNNTIYYSFGNSAHIKLTTPSCDNTVIMYNNLSSFNSMGIQINSGINTTIINNTLTPMSNTAIYAYSETTLNTIFSYNNTFNNTLVSFVSLGAFSISVANSPAAVTTETIENGRSFFTISSLGGSPWVDLNLTYNTTDISSEDNLMLHRYSGGIWSALPSTVDTSNNVVSYNISSFSDFGIFELTNFHCRYANNTGTNITNGITVALGENLRCNDTSADVVGNILNYGNLTYSNFTNIFNLTTDGQYNLTAYSGSKIIINSSNITTNNTNYEFIMVILSSEMFEMQNSYLSECGFSNNPYMKGLEIYNVSNISLVNNTITSTFEPLYIVNSYYANISFNTIDMTGGTFGMDFYNFTYGYIHNNVFRHPPTCVFDFYSNSLYTQIYLNDFYDSTATCTAVWLADSSSYFKIYNNTLNNISYGFSIAQSEHNQIYNNTITNATKALSLVSGATNNTIEDNVIFNMLETCIEISSSDNNTLSNNDISFCSDTGIQFSGSSSYNNTIKFNRFENMGDAGIDGAIYIGAGTSDTAIITNNTFINNYYCAIEDEGVNTVIGNNTIANNTATDNYGIIFIGTNGSSYDNTIENVSTGILIYQGVNSADDIITNTNYGIQFSATGGSNITRINITNSTNYDYYETGMTAGTKNTIYNMTINQTTFSATTNNIAIKEIYDMDVPANTSGLLKLDYSYLNVTKVGANGWIYLNLTYDSTKASDENMIRLYRYSGAWVNVYNDIVNTTNNYIYGNITSFSIFAAMQDTLPLITVVSPTNTTSASSWFWANTTVNKNSSWCGVSINGTSNLTLTNSSGNWNLNITAMPEGTHSATFFCNDTSGNMNSTQVIFILDTTSPVRSLGNPSGTIYTISTSLSLTTDENAVCRYANSPSIPFASMLSSTQSTSGLTHSWSLIGLAITNYNYYIKCNDTFGNINSDDYLISFAVASQPGSSGGGGGGDIGTEPEPPETVEEVTVGEEFTIPEGGTTIAIDDMLSVQVFGDTGIIYNVTKTEASKFKVILCNQTEIASYEINISAEKTYFCIDTANYSYLSSISVYQFKDNSWNKLDEVIQDGTKICGRITSTPYMIAGFSVPADSEKALYSLNLLESRISTDSSDELLSLLEQAKNAYYNCDYDGSYNLSQQALKQVSMEISSTSLWVFSILAFSVVGYYLYKNKFKNPFKKTKKKIKE